MFFRGKPAQFDFLVTQGVVDAISSEEGSEFLVRHFNGDWGDIDSVDRQINEQSITSGVRNVFSQYTARSGSVVNIVSGYGRITMRLSHELVF